MTKKMGTAAVEAAVASPTDPLVFGIGIEAFAASASAALALVSIVVAIIALRTANRNERDLRAVRLEELTDKRIAEFDSTAMVAMRAWIQTKLEAHASLNKCQPGGGLTQLNVGAPITIASENGAQSLMAGQLCIRVLQFYGRIATQITDKRIDGRRIVDVMADDIIATWTALGPHLKRKTVGDYYRWFRRRYSMSSLAQVLYDNESFEQRIKQLQARPNFWDFPAWRTRR